MGTSTSAHHGFIRGAIALHTPASSGQHRFPACGSKGGALPVRIRTRTRGITTERPRCVARSLLYPVSRCAKGRKKILSFKGPRHIHTLDPSVFSSSDQPNMFRITLPGPGDTGKLSEHEGRATETAHPGTISTSWDICRPWFCKKPAHASICSLPGACCGEASFSTAGRPTPSRILVLCAFVPPSTPAACELHEFLCPSALPCSPHELTL